MHKEAEMARLSVLRNFSSDELTVLREALAASLEQEVADDTHPKWKTIAEELLELTVLAHREREVL